MRLISQISVVLFLVIASSARAADSGALAGTKPVEIPANVYDLQYQQTENILLKRIAESEKIREKRWKRDFSSLEAYAKSVEPNRATVARLIGFGDKPHAPVAPPTLRQIAANETFTTSEIEFQLYDDVRADGLLLMPTGQGPFPVMIVCHGDVGSPELICGEGKDPADRIAQTFLSQGMAVFAPRFVPRSSDHPDCDRYHKDLRYLLHRFSYVVGKHPIGVDVGIVSGGIDAMASIGGKFNTSELRIIGTGQGGLTAMYAGALDSRIKSVSIIDAFDDRAHAYDEPPDRAIFRHLVEFDDSDVCSLITPRGLAIGFTKEPGEAVGLEKYALAKISIPLDGLTSRVLENLEPIDVPKLASKLPKTSIHPPAEIKSRRDKLYAQLEEHFHKMIEASADVRAKRWATDAHSPESWEPTQKKLREAYLDLVGRCDFLPRVALNPRSQKAYDTEDYIGYKILLDVFDGLEAYGILLIPKNIKPGERRPAVICQHGFAGNPEKTVGPSDLDQYYHRFPHNLARRGYVTFTPYIVVPTEESEWRLDRRGKIVGESRAGVCGQQYAAIVDFLQQLDFVDGHRIGYQGLSYGGFTGLWVVSQEPRISPVIVAGYFSDWKARLFDDPKGYMPIRSECMYVWEQMHTFNHSDLASMICPRPFFVEHGIEHGPNWMKWSGSEYKPVESLYIQLGIADRSRFYAFSGGHETGTEEAFCFLDKWLKFTPTKKPTGVEFTK